jgi:hypothetical protein
MTRRELLQMITGASLLAGPLAVRSAGGAQPKEGGDMPEGVTEGPVWPPYEKMQARLEQWAREHPDIMRLEVLDKTAQGRPIFAARLTDPEADDAGKEHAVLCNLHSGAERSGATALFATMQWLLSGDGLAKDILRRQLVVCMPVPNPDGYEIGSAGNTQGTQLYTSWTPDGPPDPPNNPEGMAVKRVVDELQPEVFAEYHGTDLSFPTYIMTESSGAAWSNLALRPYHYRIMELMNEAAEAEGFPSAQLEQDAEQLVWGPELDFMAGRLWTGRPRFYGGVYCYYHYHTIPLASEIAWDRSGLIRHRRLLQIGNEIWPGEYYPGYPCRVAMNNEFHKIVAYGTTAAERRKSRVELWNRQGQITHGMNNPQSEGAVLYVCATSAGGRQWFGDGTIKGFTQSLADDPKVNAQAVRRFVRRLPQRAQAGSLYLLGGGAPAEQERPIENGISFRVRIPYPKAKIKDLRLNGDPIKQSETDGYIHYVAQAFTVLQINIPPARSKAEDLFAVTCEYDPGERRMLTAGW